MDIRENVGNCLARIRQLSVHKALGLNVRNQVRSADREPSEQVEARHHRLDVVDELTRALGSKVIVDCVNQRSTRRLAHDSLDQLPILNGHGPLEVHEREGS